MFAVSGVVTGKRLSLGDNQTSWYVGGTLNTPVTGLKVGDEIVTGPFRILKKLKDGDAACGYYRSRPLLLALGVPLADALGSGMGLAGIYTHDIAETKVKATKQLAEEHEFPLLVTMEPEPEAKES